MGAKSPTPHAGATAALIVLVPHFAALDTPLIKSPASAVRIVRLVLTKVKALAVDPLSERTALN